MINTLLAQYIGLESSQLQIGELQYYEPMGGAIVLTMDS